ncbi:site-specific integrase [Rhizobium leguminosarum]|uniref:site-specific integrase n=1 Tax=Rhizobium leguminosarum TaxID=384 RepID=UPI001C981EF3|nr:site-specific integrase [Rhizobium leguminosarum]MBY5516204.1 site-specific integrase [Rhizobium leguminosarum]
MLLDILILEKTAFLAHCEKIRGLSDNTVNAYDQDIGAFIGSFQQSNPAVTFDGRVVTHYLDHLKLERNHKHATIRRRLVTLRAFATWLRKAGHIAAGPFAGT